MLYLFNQNGITLFKENHYYVHVKVHIKKVGVDAFHFFCDNADMFCIN